MSIHLQRLVGLVAAFAATMTLVAPITGANAQNFSSDPITIVIGLSAGGGTDTLARKVAPIMSEALGTPVVVENLPGASGMIAGQKVAHADPDGHTLLFTTSNEVILPSVREVPYDVSTDLTPVAALAGTAYFLGVRAGLETQDVQELVDYAKANPGKLTYSSAGVGTISHLAAAQFAHEAGIELTHVSYKGGSESAVALAGGHVDLTFLGLSSGRSLLEAEKIRLLGVSSLEPSPYLPELPTISGAGVEGYECSLWYGVFAPAGVPDEVIAALNASINKAVSTPEFKEHYEKTALFDIAGSPEDFARRVNNDLKKYKSVVEATGIKVE